MAQTSETTARREMLLNQVKQVVLTYVTHRSWWWIGAGLSLFTILLAMFADPNRRDRDSGAAVVAFPVMFLSIFLVTQAKSQFAHSRARLMPRFRTAHLIVLGSLLAFLCGLLPLAVALRTGTEPLGILALTAAMGASLIWGTQLNRSLPTFFGLALFYSLMSAWGQNFWIREAAFYREVHAIIFLASVALVAAWPWRLAHIDEEMEDYQNTLVAMVARRTGSEAVEQRRIVATQIGGNRLFASVGDWWHARLGGYYGGGSAGLARLLRYGFAAVPVELNGLFFALMAVCMVAFFTQFSFLGKNPSSIGGAFLIVQFGVLMPGQIAGEFLAQRRARIAMELLLPISRGQLIDGLFAASIRNTATVWAMVHAAMGFMLLATETHVATQTIAIFVLLSFATTMAMMGVSIRVSVWPSMFKRIMVSVLAWAILVPPILVWAGMRNNEYPALFLGLAVLLAGVGIAMIRWARRAWLELEMG